MSNQVLCRYSWTAEPPYIPHHPTASCFSAVRSFYPIGLCPPAWTESADALALAAEPTFDRSEAPYLVIGVAKPPYRDPTRSQVDSTSRPRYSHNPWVVRLTRFSSPPFGRIWGGPILTPVNKITTWCTRPAFRQAWISDNPLTTPGRPADSPLYPRFVLESVRCSGPGGKHGG